MIGYSFYFVLLIAQEASQNVKPTESPKDDRWLWSVVIYVVVPLLVAAIPVIFSIRRTRKKHKAEKTAKQKELVASVDKMQFEISVESVLKQLYDEARMLKENGLYHAALKKLDDTITIRVEYVNAYLMKGRIYLDKLKQYSKAIDEFRRGLAYDPDNKYLLYNLGLAYYHLGEPKQAINYNEKALTQDPDFIPAIYNHAIYHVDCAKKYNDATYYTKAIGLYENVIERDQDCGTWAMFNLACLYGRLSKQVGNSTTRNQYVKKAVELLDRCVAKEGLERLKKVNREIRVPYGEDLDPVRRDPAYNTMIKKWKRSLIP